MLFIGIFLIFKIASSIWLLLKLSFQTTKINAQMERNKIYIRSFFPPKFHVLQQ